MGIFNSMNENYLINFHSLLFMNKYLISSIIHTPFINQAKTGFMYSEIINFLT
jgi:hypothetical protein